LAAELGETAVAMTADVTDRDCLVAAANRIRPARRFRGCRGSLEPRTATMSWAIES
jgi:hypothetical protein